MTDTPAAPSALPERLRLETRDLHVAAERSGAMSALLHGRLERPRYVALLRNLHAIYTALEAALELQRGDAGVAALRLPALYRTAALAADLGTLYGPRWAAGVAIAPAAVAYVQRLDALAAVASPNLVAHAYVRYLGDLHGGQILSTLVRKTYGLGAAGTAFYDFGSTEDVRAARGTFREGLAAVPATLAGMDAIVAEARWAFRQHQRLFEELLPG